MNNQEAESNYLTLLKIRTDARRTINQGKIDNRARKVYLVMLERNIKHYEVKLSTVQR